MPMVKKKLLYQEAYSKILEILSGYQKGDMLPGRGELMKITGMSQRPIQQAVDMLVKEGVLTAVKGQGSFFNGISQNKEKPDEQSINRRKNFNHLEYSMPSPAKKKLRFGIMPAEWSAFAGMWQAVAKKYHASHSDIDIEFVSYSPDRLTEEDMRSFDILQISADSLPRIADRECLFNLGELGFEPKKGFYPCFTDGVLWNSKCWGLPHVAATNCYFQNKEYLEDSSSLLQNGLGFWSFLESLSSILKSGKIERGISGLVNTFPIEDLFRSTNPNAEWIVNEETIKPTNEFKNFLCRIEKYYCDPEIFYCESSRPSDIRDMFFQKKGLLISGNSCWIPDMLLQESLAFGILPSITEKGCYNQVNCLIHAISNYTTYPEECLDFLVYLSSFDSLKYFAENGRLTSRQDANRNLQIKNIDGDSLASLAYCLENGKVLKVMTPELRYNLFALVYYELNKWQHGTYSANEVFEILQRKIVFYIRGLQRKKDMDGEK